MRKYSGVLALLAVTITSTLAFAQDRIRIEASRGGSRYDDVKWSALSCYSPPCAANQPLDTNGNGKPYLLQVDQCDSKVEAWEREWRVDRERCQNARLSRLHAFLCDRETRASDAKFFGLARLVLAATLRRL